MLNVFLTVQAHFRRKQDAKEERRGKRQVNLQKSFMITDTVTQRFAVVTITILLQRTSITSVTQAG